MLRPGVTGRTGDKFVYNLIFAQFQQHWVDYNMVFLDLCACVCVVIVVIFTTVERTSLKYFRMYMRHKKHCLANIFSY